MSLVSGWSNTPKPSSMPSALAVFSCRPNSHPFQERHVYLDEPVKIGRSVARCRPAQNNATFDCKVLSRNHALLWFDHKTGKVSLLTSRMIPTSVFTLLGTIPLRSHCQAAMQADMLNWGCSRHVQPPQWNNWSVSHLWVNNGSWLQV